jgi:uncharacterized Fe-S cluster-containing radical SAM superfamily protein
VAIDTETVSARYRARLIDRAGRRVLISRIRGSAQEKDLAQPTNVDGLGRVRHFVRHASSRWIPNPLPIDPACWRLGLPPTDMINAQVFQDAACNWRCWYCYVPFASLSAAAERSQWAEARELVSAYLSAPNRPPILDLSGGQPELVPEWVLWTIEALGCEEPAKNVYLWSDDNLSNDYFWRYLDEKQRRQIVECSNYGRVGCFKGFDEASFSFNTAAAPELFTQQFELFRRYIAEGLDMYAYVTFTHAGGHSNVKDAMRRFVDRLQDVDPMLPLRTVPLEITVFGPVVRRLNESRRVAIDAGQYHALDNWRSEIESRFSSDQRRTPIQLLKWANHQATTNR